MGHIGSCSRAARAALGDRTVPNQKPRQMKHLQRPRSAENSITHTCSNSPIVRPDGGSARRGLEHGDRFDVRCVREHVDDARGLQTSNRPRERAPRSRAQASPDCRRRRRSGQAASDAAASARATASAPSRGGSIRTLSTPPLASTVASQSARLHSNRFCRDEACAVGQIMDRRRRCARARSAWHCLRSRRHARRAGPAAA